MRKAAWPHSGACLAFLKAIDQEGRQQCALELSEAMVGLVRDFRFRIANRKETNGRADRCS